MKSGWKVASNLIDDTKMYAVYRLRDAGAVDHSGNREYGSDWLESRADALYIAEQLNLHLKDKPCT